MIIMLLIFKALCEVEVITGFSNEIRFFYPGEYNSQNIQDYNNEYITYNYSQKNSSIISIKLREVNLYNLQFLEIWLLCQNQSYFQIMKIIPSYNKTELIYDFNSSDLVCMNIYIQNDNIILHCKHLLSKQLTLIKYNKMSKIVQQQMLKIVILEKVSLFFDDYFIIQYQNKIVFYDIDVFIEMKTLTNQSFNMKELNIKKLIVQNRTMVVLTHDFQCRVVYLYEKFKIQEIYNHLPILDIFMNQQYGLLVISNQSIEQIVNFGILINQGVAVFEQQQFQYQIINQSQFAYKYNFLSQEYQKLNNCLLKNIVQFIYNLQMIICLEQNQFSFIQITPYLFKKVSISNSINQQYIMRTLKSGEIKIFDFDREFFPILNLESDTITLRVKQNIFHGPNITLEFRSQQTNIQYQEYKQLENLNSCIYYEIYYSRDLYDDQEVQEFNLICQLDNKTIIIKSSNHYYILEINFFLENFKLLKYTTQNLFFIDENKQELLIVTPQKTIQYSIQNYKMVSISNYIFILFQEKIIYFKEHYTDDIFEIMLTDFYIMEIYQEIIFIYISYDNKYLFICTENSIIILLVYNTSYNFLIFYVTQIIQTQNTIKQIYFSNKILYLIFQDNLMSIKKYYQISNYHFELIGDVDCLGYKFNNIITNNRASDYFYIASNNSILIFKLSNSLQNSFLGMIPDAEYVQSSDLELIIKRNGTLLVYVYDQITIQFQRDISHSQLIPIEICASNSYSKQCLNQFIKLVRNNFPLQIQDYQLNHIQNNRFIINFNIIQGFIKDISLNNAQLNQLKLLFQKPLSFNEILIQGNYFVFVQQPKIISFKFNESVYETVQLEFNCQRATFIGHYFLCQELNNYLFVYDCTQFPSCHFIYDININIRPIQQIISSGLFILIIKQDCMQILKFDENNIKQFINIYKAFKQPSKSLIQHIGNQHLWLISLNKLNLELLVLEDQKILHKFMVDLHKLFNTTQQFVDESDLILNIRIIQYSDLQVTILFLMKKSSHKVIRFTNINNHLDTQCLCLLLNNQQNAYQHFIFSFVNDLLFIVFDHNLIGAYNLSTTQNQYLRNFIFVLHLQQPNFNQMIRFIHLHKFQNKFLLLVVLYKKFCYFEVSLDYTIELESGLNTININKQKENLQFKIHHIIDEKYNNIIENITIIALILIYIIIRIFKTNGVLN